MPTELKSPSGCRSTGEVAGEKHCCVGLVASHRDPRLTIYPHNGWLPHPHPPVYFTISPHDRVRGSPGDEIESRIRSQTSTSTRTPILTPTASLQTQPQPCQNNHPPSLTPPTGPRG
ncbi:hypothetical protein Pmani_034439 [Petrolisthes manimaculis]|uniref:Uncharacterized protein n=1 Tax=Petrolisthes manimaculis TaxID=1843537 RepID=A0AAE1TPE5_9EUCA|nr:hypothetical protein Pmani_034439 [Petrolisthes manimaculis]